MRQLGHRGLVAAKLPVDFRGQKKLAKVVIEGSRLKLRSSPGNVAWQACLSKYLWGTFVTSDCLSV